MSQFESKLASFTIYITQPPRAGDTLQGLAVLADRVFSLHKQYSASTSGTSVNVPPDTPFNRFAVVFYPIIQMGDPDFFPVKAILHENRPEQSLQVVVDFQTRTVKCENQEANLHIEPEQIERVLKEIKVHIRDDWEINGVKRPTDWRDFLHRLESNGVLPANLYPDPHPTSIHKQCPLCETRTSRCTLCYAIMCSNRACIVSEVIPLKSCARHPSRAMCLPCLETETIEWRLCQCPHCELWFCFSDLIWCVGRTTDFSGSSSDSGEHPTKPIGCSSCAEGRDRCANRNCWSNPGELSAGVCKSCSPKGGLWCVCRQSWICDTCSTSPTVNVLVKCPRCGEVYCSDECNYIGFCSECDRTTVCDDCFEEDWDVAVDVVVLKKKCSMPDCTKWVCAECLQSAQCADCCDPTCRFCSLQASGDLGDGRLCSPCYYKRFEEAVEREFTFE